MDIGQLLSSYPRRRPPLPAPYQRVYEEEYRLNRSGEGPVYGLVKLLESWMHRRIARVPGPARILELGAGGLNHLDYEPDAAAYDIVEPVRIAYAGSARLGRVRTVFDDVADIPVDTRYDRVLSIAVLEHQADLPGIIARTGLLLAPGGRFQAGIPTEGGLLWYLAWRFGTGLAYRRRTGLSYGPLMRHEHINRADEIETLVRHFFGRVSIQRFPMPFRHASIYSYIEGESPVLDRCRNHAPCVRLVVASIGQPRGR